MTAKENFDISGLPDRRSLADDVVERLRQAIWTGQFQPGMRLREEELADMLRVSRGPVREAISQLEREGLVVKQPNRSALVARLSPADLEEVYSLRLALEQFAIQQAMRNAKPEHIAALQNKVNQMAAALERGTTEKEAAELDVQFHDIIYEAANHKRLYECWALLRPQVHVFLLSRNVANPDFREIMLSAHQNLTDAIRDRDAERGMRLTAEHLQSAYERILRGYTRPAALPDREKDR